MSTRHVLSDRIVGRISPAAVSTENWRASVQPRARRYSTAWRTPLPESSASEPSGLTIRTSRDVAGLARLAQLEHAVGAHPRVAVAQAAHELGVQRRRALAGVDDQVVVAQRLPLLEAHQPSNAGRPSMLRAFLAST